MGTLLEITSADDGGAAFAEVERLDRLLSTFKDGSEVSRLNRAAGAGPVKVSDDLWSILQVSSSVWAASGGAFDPTYSSSPPARGFGRLRLDASARSVELPAGARLDFGGVGKGYALDAAASALRARGISSAFLNFGGQVYALGAWEVETPGARLPLRDASASTSGDAEQPGHIVAPGSWRPARKAGSATVVLPSAAEADAWSTALFAAGPKALPRDFPGCALVVSDEGGRPERFGHCPRRVP
ncbi:MAG: FAD:protein FMN transferase [Elusimicrobia bacterium]|nr:FAD:protein FMN transferase [Elusimicrobiota bacterium]